MMEFNADSSIQKVVAIGAAVISFSSLTMLFAASGAGAFFVLLMTVATGVIAAGAWKYQHHVSVSKTTGQIQATRGTLGMIQKQRFRLSEFSAVGIVTAGRSSSGGGATSVYSVQLIGKTNVSLPGGGTDLNAVSQEAEALADYLEIPFERKPAIGFFGRRL